MAVILVVVIASFRFAASRLFAAPIRHNPPVCGMTGILAISAAAAPSALGIIAADL